MIEVAAHCGSIAVTCRGRNTIATNAVGTNTETPRTANTHARSPHTTGAESWTRHTAGAHTWTVGIARADTRSTFATGTACTTGTKAGSAFAANSNAIGGQPQEVIELRAVRTALACTTETAETGACAHPPAAARTLACANWAAILSCPVEATGSAGTACCATKSACTLTSPTSETTAIATTASAPAEAVVRASSTSTSKSSTATTTTAAAATTSPSASEAAAPAVGQGKRQHQTYCQCYQEVSPDHGSTLCVWVFETCNIRTPFSTDVLAPLRRYPAMQRQRRSARPTARRRRFRPSESES